VGEPRGGMWAGALRRMPSGEDRLVWTWTRLTTIMHARTTIIIAQLQREEATSRRTKAKASGAMSLRHTAGHLGAGNSSAALTAPYTIDSDSSLSLGCPCPLVICCICACGNRPPATEDELTGPE
jgi:hypothetical protein